MGDRSIDGVLRGRWWQSAVYVNVNTIVACPARAATKKKNACGQSSLANKTTVTENKLIILAQTRLRSRVGGQDDTKKSFPGITATFFSLRWQ
jgi:hypothetical protein